MFSDKQLRAPNSFRVSFIAAIFRKKSEELDLYVLLKLIRSWEWNQIPHFCSILRIILGRLDASLLRAISNELLSRI